MAWDCGDFAFGPATRADEPDLRRLVGSTPMPGALSIRFEREPDYFLGCDIAGRDYEVLIARHRGSGELAGMMCRTEDDVFLNGEPTKVGGICQVRIAPHFRGLRLLELGWPVFRHRGIPYLGVIARDNPRAVTALVERAPGAPTLRRVGGITTVGLPVGRTTQGPWRRVLHRWPRPPAGVRVEPAGADDVGDIVEFLNTEGARFQFAPVRRQQDFSGGRRFRGLDLPSIYLARESDRIVATLALWDQRGYKQDVVDSYGPAIGRIRPMLDITLRAFGAKTLPDPGEVIEGAWAALPVVAGDDPAVFTLLLGTVLAAARERGLSWVTLGLSDDDPLLAVARRRLHVTYRSDLYSASWDHALPELDGRRSYVEAATF